jgi:hypothetical protein
MTSAEEVRPSCACLTRSGGALAGADFAQRTAARAPAQRQTAVVVVPA